MSLKNYAIPFALFVALASPGAFKLTHRALGGFFSSTEGVAYFPGLLFHAVVFVLLVGFFMRVVPRISGFETRKDQQASEYVHWAQRNEVD
jgi:hypothetical protein